MSYRQRIDNDDNESALLTNRVGLHSNPFLNSSIILSPPNTGLIPSFGLAGNFPNNVIGTAMGTTDDEFCMNGIAKNYINGKDTGISEIRVSRQNGEPNV